MKYSKRKYYVTTIVMRVCLSCVSLLMARIHVVIVNDDDEVKIMMISEKWLTLKNKIKFTIEK